jgi:hypothetical protein
MIRLFRSKPLTSLPNRLIPLYSSSSISKTTTTIRRCLSSQQQQQQQQQDPPSSITKEIAYGIQNTNELFIRHGIARRKLEDLAKHAGNVDTLVERWQKMMEAFLSTQVHVLAGLGYHPSEVGLETYNRQLATFMHNADPDTTEDLRLKSRDLWRQVLATAFDIPLEDTIQKSDMLSIVDARNIMHKVAQKMQSPDILEHIAGQCARLESTGDQAKDFAEKHQIVQETLVHEVYLGGEPMSLVEECGFEPGERGYVFMQCVMAEHQTDPLIGQYIGSAMMKVLQSAGVDLSAAMQQQGK